MHLTQAQRYEIAALLKTNTPQKKIAEVIGVHPSTICREIKRNLTPAGNYSPTQAHIPSFTAKTSFGAFCSET